MAEIAERLSAAGNVAVLLDFDGTLAPIAPAPDLARLEPAMRATLLSLSEMPRVLVAIVSGRALEDVRERVGVAGLIYAGCHGLAISGRGLEFVEPEAQRRELALRLLSEQLAARLEPVSGVLVENKGMGISVHYRRVAAQDRQEVAQAVRMLTSQWGERIRVRRGRQVWEISPAVDWHKGRAAQWILRHAAGPDALSIFIGDDLTDEDAFCALRDGITIKVGDAAGSAAEWSVTGPAEVGAFLLWLRSRLE
ncbi:MAG: trehalose-phosphatase [Bryobacterales bacterium]|nr:trehalose-phosphatase [Bryobacterales bacterium]